VAQSLIDVCSGIRTAKNVVFEADKKVKEHQDRFNNLRKALQEKGVINTEITVLRVLDIVDDLGEFSECRPFPRLINFALSQGNSA
jgi:hypothetical protein